MPLTEIEIRAIGAKIVATSKRTARFDTGALKRSISFSYVRKIMIFRELFYGQFSSPAKGLNSQLEKNAVKMVPNGVEWKIVYTNFSGAVTEIGRTRAGRATQRTILKGLITTGTSTNIRALIARNKAKKIAAKKLENGET